MKNTVLSLGSIVILSACNLTQQQGFLGLQAVGSLVIDENYRHQRKQICGQQGDPALRLQCEQQAQKEFQKYQLDQRKNNDE